MLRRPMRLSKSRLVAYRQCPKRLWLQTYRRELARQSPILNRMAQGHMVGAAARRLHPDAVATTRGRLQQARALADRNKASPAEYIARCVQRISLGAKRTAIVVRLAAVWGSSCDPEHDDATTELGVPLQLRRCEDAAVGQGPRLHGGDAGIRTRRPRAPNASAEGNDPLNAPRIPRFGHGFGHAMRR